MTCCSLDPDNSTEIDEDDGGFPSPAFSRRNRNPNKHGRNFKVSLRQAAEYCLLKSSRAASVKTEGNSSVLVDLGVFVVGCRRLKVCFGLEIKQSTV